MKKYLSILLLSMALMPFSSVSVKATPVIVPLEVSIVDPEIEHGEPQRGPVTIPVVYIEDGILSFGTPCDGYVLRIVNASGQVEYTTVIPTNATSLVLPSTLSGDYELQIVQGYWCFYGDITL